MTTVSDLQYFLKKYQDLFQPFSCDCFSKISRIFYSSRKSWIIVLFLQCTLKPKLLFILINSPLLHIPLLALTDRRNHGQRNEYTCFAWAGGTFFPVVLLCCVSFWFWQEIGFSLHTHVLRVQYSCGFVLVFWLRWEIVFGVMYILSAQYNCAVVSVFWLWREIVLKMRTCFYKKILLGYFIMIR